MEAAEPRQLAAGTMLDDKYRIERLLAVGGMGSVYEGTHIKLRKRVAIKVLNPQLSTPTMIERFHREAITASQIGHEGIAQVTDLGTSGDGEPFIVMEFLDGESLASRLRARGALPIDVACELACAMLSPLEAAHAAGIVHRDLKPDNVFLVRQSLGELVKLLDFGISRATALENEFKLTTTGVVLGTPYYMSPEQARGDSAIGRATDIYSVGVILYEMLIGRVPITGENYNQLMYHVMNGEFVPAIQQRPDIPATLDRIINQTMASDPQHRPTGAGELAQMLAGFCRSTTRPRTSGAAIPVTGLAIARPGAAVASPVTGTERTMAVSSASPFDSANARTTPSRRSRVPFMVAGATLLVLGAAAAVAIGTTGAASPIPESRSTSPTSPTVVATPVADAGVLSADVVGSTGRDAGAAVAHITLRFAVEPAFATVTVDRQAVIGGELVVTADTKAHHLEIVAPGFVRHDSELRFDENQRLVVELKHVVRAGATPSPHPATGRTHSHIEDQSPYK